MQHSKNHDYLRWRKKNRRFYEVSLNLILVSGKHLFRTGLRIILETSGWKVTECCDAVTALSELSITDCDVVVADLCRDDPDGIALAAAIRERWPGLPIVILTELKKDNHVVDALREGASGYLTASSSGAQLVTALAAVTGGAIYIGNAAAEPFRNWLNQPYPNVLSSLEPREASVLNAVMSGYNNREIAESLNLSVSRVKSLMRGLFEKFEVSNRTLLAAEAARRITETHTKRSRP